eukprot:TRINITY_DN4825_c0_g1_i2.p1 TRINITY_DN4825_c0_g1~~TRINITY_DN4825_c0_g1_i2.p1  ORF type:complete len:352 (-),score=53.70 TRINITY_DN4825_c0_g1_i2:702-1757(-)
MEALQRALSASRSLIENTGRWRKIKDYVLRKKFPKNAQFANDTLKVALCLNFRENLGEDAEKILFPTDSSSPLLKLTDSEQEAYLHRLYSRLSKDLHSKSNETTNQVKESNTSEAEPEPSPSPELKLPEPPNGMAVRDMLLSEQYIFNQVNIKRQLWEMFDRLAKDETLRTDLQMIRNAKALVGVIRDAERRKIAFNEERRIRDGKAHHPRGFALTVRRSSIPHPEAGMGVFIEGKAVPGTVLTMYSGVVRYPREIDLDRLKGRASRVKEYMFARYDGAIFDGHAWTREAFEWRQKRIERVLYLKGMLLGLEKSDLKCSSGSRYMNTLKPQERQRVTVIMKLLLLLSRVNC